MLKKITAINGFRCCGKSLLGQMIYEAFNKIPTIRLLDMSDAIRHFLKFPDTALGHELQKYREAMDNGKVIPNGHLVYHVCMSYLDLLDKQSGRVTTHLILPGGMRTIEEAMCFEALNVSIRVIHVNGTFGDMLTGVTRRNESGVIRGDSSTPEKLKNGWNDYLSYTVPTVNAFHDDHCCEIKFGISLREKVVKSIGALDILPKRKKQLLRRISSKKHPASVAIDNYDNPAKPNSTRQPHPVHSALPVQSTLMDEDVSAVSIATNSRFQAAAMPA